MKSDLFILALLTLLGLAAGVVILPSHDELALMHMSAGRFEQARRHMDDSLAEAPATVHTLLPMLELRFQRGDVEGAIAALEQFVAANPDILESRTLLGRYYRVAQRPMDELRNLEQIRNRHPSLKVLEELVSRYDLLAMYDQEIDVLFQLVREYPQHPQHFIRLAELLVTRERWLDAVDVIHALRGAHPESIDADIILLLVDTLILSGNPKEALAESREWLQGRFDPEYAAMFGDLLHYGVGPELAWSLLEPWLGSALRSNELLAKWIELAGVMNKQERVLPTLVKRYRQDKLPPKVWPQLSELALKNGNIALAQEVAARLESPAFPGWLKDYFIDRALADQNRAIADFIAPHLDATHLTHMPLKAASLAWLREEKTEATRLLDWAWKQGYFELEDLNLGISLLTRMGERKKAMEWARKAVMDPSASEWLISDLARFFIDEKQPEEGLALFSHLKGRRDLPAVRQGWALLATMTSDRHNDQVIAWLDQEPGLLQPFLSEMAYGAFNYRNLKVAAAAAEKLHRLTGNDADQRLRAEILLALGKPEEAMKLARVDDAGSNTDARRFYGRIVREAWEKGFPVKPEMRRLLVLSRHSPDRYALATDAADLGWMALELGERQMAQDSFFKMARKAGPDDPSVLQLLHLWGPTPPSEGLAWLVGRAREDIPKNRALWLQRLLDVDRPQSVIQLGRAFIEERGPDSKIEEQIMEALLLQGETQEAQRFLIRQIEAAHASSEQLRALGKQASALDMGAASLLAYEALLKQDPYDLHALRTLAAADFFNHRWDRSETRYRRLLSRNAGEPLDFLRLGEAIINQGRESHGQAYLRQALGLLEKQNPKGFDERAMIARLRDRLGLKQKACVLYARLVEERPKDHALRAEYVSLLLEMNQTDLARRTLAQLEATR
ncbi:MAG TPA: hypothetical protein HPQ00_00985 [Magnetococcales bacterium]|nr:hypothetical protein [Magnetococcales bacterium]